MQEIIGALTLGSIYLLFALGMSIVWGSIGILNFAHGAIFMFSAFICHQILKSYEAPFVVVALLGMLVGSAMSVLMQVLVFEQILKRSTSERSADVRILIGGIGAGIIPLAIAEHITKNQAFGLERSSFDIHVFEVADLRITNIQIITLACAGVLAVAIGTWLNRSRQGLALRSIGVDAEVASMMGINRARLATVTMAFAGALAGLAGVLLTYQLGALTPDSGDILLVKAFACVILGGLGSTLGVVTGCFMLAAAETFVLTQTSGMWVEAIAFGLIFVVLLVRPVGLFGRQEVRRV
nr:branched-chain amino acid transporter permease [Aeromicrobium sp.]